jgi:threonine/homoserine/homoserine lactone efflux protein
MHVALQLLIITGVLLLSVVSPGPNFALLASTAQCGVILIGMGDKVLFSR